MFDFTLSDPPTCSTVSKVAGNREKTIYIHTCIYNESDDS